MDLLEKIGLFAKAVKEEAPDEVKAEAEAEVKEDIKKAEDPKEILMAEIVAKKDFLEFKASVEPFIDAVIDYIKNQPGKDELIEMANQAANDKLAIILKAIKTDGHVPEARELHLETADVKNMDAVNAFNESIKRKEAEIKSKFN